MAKTATATESINDKLMTKSELAARLSVHPKSIENYMRRDALPTVRLGTSVRFRWSSIEAWLAERESATTAPR